MLSTTAGSVTAAAAEPASAAALSDGYPAALLVGGALVAVGALSCPTIPRSTVDERWPT